MRWESLTQIFRKHLCKRYTKENEIHEGWKMISYVRSRNSTTMSRLYIKSVVHGIKIIYNYFHQTVLNGGG